MRSIKLDQAVEMIPDGASLMVGGFLGIGSPELVIDELVRQQKKNLTIIANDTARPGIGVGKLVSANAVSKAVVSHIGLNREAQQQMMSGGMIIELVPQGCAIVVEAFVDLWRQLVHSRQTSLHSHGIGVKRAAMRDTWGLSGSIKRLHDVSPATKGAYW